jgi:hypothetical protein
LNSGPCACHGRTLPLEPHPQPFFVLAVFQAGSQTLILLPIPPK